MSILPKYNFTDTDGSTHANLTAGQIHRQFLPWRSEQWVKRGLESGARSVAELVAAAELRLSIGIKAAKRGSLNSPMRAKRLDDK